MTDRTVTTDDGVRLRTTSDGDPSAPGLLLLNSLGTDLTMWDRQVEEWAIDHQVVRFDQRGHGASDAPEGPYTIERLGRDAIAVMDAHGLDRPAVCGLSLGGLVALEIAARWPHRTDRAVFADTAARIGSSEAWQARAATVRDRGMGAVTDLVLDRFFSPSVRSAGGPVVARVEHGLLTTPVAGYAGSCDALALADLSGLAPEVQAPCLVIVGSEDAATPPADAEALCELLPDARLEEIPGAGHLANLERPSTFTGIVREFLSAPGSPPPVAH